MESRGRRRISVWLALACYGAFATAAGCALGYLVLRHMDWVALRSNLAAASVPLLLLAVAAMLGAGYLRGVRWHVLLATDQVSVWRLFLIEQTGAGLDTLSPVRVLDEIVEVGILTVRDHLNLGLLLATMALQRTLEFAVLVLLLGGGTLLLAPFRPFWPYLLAGMAVGLLSLAMLFTLGPALGRIRLLRRFSFSGQFGEGVGLLWRSPERAGLAFLLSIGQAVLLGLTGWLVALATHTSIGLLEMVVVTLAVLFFGNLPGLPLSFGTLDFGAITLLGLWGVSASDAGAYALALRAVVFLPPVAIAVLFLAREGLLSMRRLTGMTAASAGKGPAP